MIFIQSSFFKTISNYIQETWALYRRLIIQTQRRPATFIAGLFQPLLWLILFGALFQNAPVELFSISKSYRHFLTPGILVFTTFTGALNGGLPLMFDREFGFFNRLIVSPLTTRQSIIMASALFISTITLIQTLCVLGLMSVWEIKLHLINFLITIIILVLLTCALTMCSISASLILPGHIELLALIFIINLPLLFASTALVPFSFMPMWLQILASLNPLSYTIETIRSIYFSVDWTWSTIVVETLWGTLSLSEVILLLVILNFILGIIAAYCITIKVR
uniref:ABC-2 type transporter n=1 Tax=Chroothece richteriana TaxID=101928 RepID=UPI001FCE0D63|nr:ABC-2 type transporter [Chroothece richteriana]UNJ14218.1 ABC-2 type transporter [Chroothece richteriana]